MPSNYVFNLEEARHKISYIKLMAAHFLTSECPSSLLKSPEEEEKCDDLEDDTCLIKNLHFLCFREGFIERIRWELSPNFNSGKFTYVDCWKHR